MFQNQPTCELLYKGHFAVKDVDSGGDGGRFLSWSFEGSGLPMSEGCPVQVASWLISSWELKQDVALRYPEHSTTVACRTTRTIVHGILVHFYLQCSIVNV